eukprot:1159502-Pelagomonas_calceolata.AAC.17
MKFHSVFDAPSVLTSLYAGAPCFQDTVRDSQVTVHVRSPSFAMICQHETGTWHTKPSPPNLPAYPEY